MQIEKIIFLDLKSGEDRNASVLIRAIARHGLKRLDRCKSYILSVIDRFGWILTRDLTL